MAINVAIINGKEPSGGAGGVSDAEYSSFAVDFLNPGALGSTAFQLVEPSGTSKTVVVTAGTYYAANSSGSMVYKVVLDTDTSVAIADNASANPRITAVVLKIDTSTTPDSTASNVATLETVDGTAAATAVAPTDGEIQTDVGSGNVGIRLGNVDAASGFTTIEDADIEDTRTTTQIAKENLEPIGTDQLVQGFLKGRYQSHNSGGAVDNSDQDGLTIQFGWKQMEGNGTASITDTVTFPTAFSTILWVQSTFLGADSGAMTSITDLTNPISNHPRLGVNSISTTGFSFSLERNTSTFGVSAYYSITWMAIGII